MGAADSAAGAVKPRGRLGGRAPANLGVERFRQMAVQLHRHRAAFFADESLRPSRKARLVTALDALLQEVQAMIPGKAESSSVKGT